MSNHEDKLGIALVKEACRLCGAVEDGPIIMNKVLTKPKADKVKEMNGKVVGYMEKPCKDCQEIMNKSILLIGVVETKTTDHNNPYRSGNKWGVTEDFVRRAFSGMADEIIKKRASFISVEAANKMGFPDCNLDA